MKKLLFPLQPNTKLKMKNTLFVSYEFAPLRLGRIIQSLVLTCEEIASMFNKYCAATAYLAGRRNRNTDSQKEIEKNIKPSILILPTLIDWFLHSSIVGKLIIINPKPAAL